MAHIRMKQTVDAEATSSVHVGLPVTFNDELIAAGARLPPLATRDPAGAISVGLVVKSRHGVRRRLLTNITILAYEPGKE
ncbi:hypothetical protein RR46_08303 [Papilio xuthus]|uniref:Uncharacterized protein n=1 Tax=Papilio xuthus TaxID=66420 RepID=A0A194PF21_PAPXU|nr:hypothetical protein RR46_08303 [Papilio xuthus]